MMPWTYTDATRTAVANGLGESRLASTLTTDELASVLPYTPTSAETNAPILAQLDALDAKSVRAARAVAVALAKGATPDATDLAKLAAIEAQAATLRGQLVS